MKKFHKTGITIISALAPACALGITAGVVIATAMAVKVSTEDKEFLNKMNSNLPSFASDYVAPQTAIDYLKNKQTPIDVLGHKWSDSRQELAFDATEQQFIIMTGDKILAGPNGYSLPTDTSNVFKFVKTYDANSKYAQYLLEGYAETTLDAKTSLDTGNNSFEKITYTSATTNANDSKTVILRTTTNQLNITSSDTVYHMNKANVVTVSGTSASDACKLVETGTVTCLKASNTSLTTTSDGSGTTAAIGSLEVGSNVTSDSITSRIVSHYTGTGTIPEWSSRQKDTDTPITSASEIATTLTTDKAYLKLSNDISFSADQYVTVSGSITVTIDLNGHSIADTLAVGNTARIKAVSGATLYIINSNPSDSSAINLKGHCIQACDNSVLYLNGVNINYECTANAGAVVVGENTNTGTATVNVNGASIISSRAEGYESKWAYGIVTKLNGHLNYNNGYIKAYAPCIGGNGLWDNTVINIKDGTFESEDVCIFNPQDGDLTIEGGKFSGKTCLGVKAGDTVINGGTFEANGEFKTDETISSTFDGIVAEGSVIFVDAPDAEYGQNLNVTINNATMSSKNGHILRGTGLFAAGHFTGPANITFKDGTYTYAQEDPLHLINSSVASQYIVVTKEGGTWTKI